MENHVAISVSKEIINPIVKAKVDAMVLEALGGKDDLVKKIVDMVCSQRVNSKGEVSTYSSENKYSWLDITLTNQVKNVIEQEIRNQITQNAEVIKKSVIEFIATKKGANMVASALVDAMSGSFAKNWSSQFQVSFTKRKDN